MTNFRSQHNQSLIRFLVVVARDNFKPGESLKDDICGNDSLEGEHEGVASIGSIFHLDLMSHQCLGGVGFDKLEPVFPVRLALGKGLAIARDLLFAAAELGSGLVVATTILAKVPPAVLASGRDL